MKLMPDGLYHKLTIAHSIIFGLIILAGVGKGLSKIPQLKEKWEKSQAKHASVQVPTTTSTPISIEAFELKINPTEARQIEQVITRVKKRGVLTNIDKIWFPATFYSENDKYKCKIRIRGDLSAHWSDVKRSWRIRFSKNRLFRGLREINLVIPEDKSFEIEYLAYKLGTAAGLLTPDHGYSVLKINNVMIGAYLWFEQWDRSSMEKRATPNDEIYGQNNVWTDTRRNGMAMPDVLKLFPAYKEFTRKDDEPKLHGKIWEEFLWLVFDASDEQFWKRMPQILDLEKYISWNAITWLFNSQHSHWGDNLRWRYNTTNGKFEPILYDISLYPFSPERSVFETRDHDPLARRIFHNPELHLKRDRKILELASHEESDMFPFVREHLSALAEPLQTGIGKDRLKPHHLVSIEEKHLSLLSSVREGLLSQLHHARIFMIADLRSSQSGKVEIELLPESLDGIRLTKFVLPIGSPGIHPNVVLIGPDGTSHSLPATSGELGISVTLAEPLLNQRNENLRLKQTSWKLKLSWPKGFKAPPTFYPIVEAINHLDGQSLPPEMLYTHMRAL